MKLLLALLTLAVATVLTPTACGGTRNTPAHGAPSAPNAVPAGPYVHVHVLVLDGNAEPADRSFSQIIALGLQGDGKSIPLVVVTDKGGAHSLSSTISVYARYVPDNTVSVSVTIAVTLKRGDTAAVTVTNEHGRSMPHEGFDYYEQPNETGLVAIRLTVPIT